MKHYTLERFTEELASDSPVPGGGGAAALAGALAASLEAMVLNLSGPKAAGQEEKQEIQRLLERAQSLRTRFLDFIDEDARAFEPMLAAMKMPRKTAEERKVRAGRREEALQTAAATPLQMMRETLEMIRIADCAARYSSRFLISDTAAAALMAHCAMMTASLNVTVNVEMMADRAKAEELLAEQADLMEQGERLTEKVVHSVKRRMTQNE